MVSAIELVVRIGLACVPIRATARVAAEFGHAAGDPVAGSRHQSRARPDRQVSEIGGPACERTPYQLPRNAPVTNRSMANSTATGCSRDRVRPRRPRRPASRTGTGPLPGGACRLPVAVTAVGNLKLLWIRCLSSTFEVAKRMEQELLRLASGSKFPISLKAEKDGE